MRVHEAVTDAEGRYRIENLTPDPFMVAARRAPGDGLAKPCGTTSASAAPSATGRSSSSPLKNDSPAPSRHR